MNIFNQNILQLPCLQQYTFFLDEGMCGVFSPWGLTMDWGCTAVKGCYCSLSSSTEKELLFLLILSVEWEGFSTTLLLIIWGWLISPLVLLAIGSSFLGGLLSPELFSCVLAIGLPFGSCNLLTGLGSCTMTALLSSRTWLRSGCAGWLVSISMSWLYLPVFWSAIGYCRIDFYGCITSSSSEFWSSLAG